MAAPSIVDQETMYQAWVAHHRNGNKAAAALGIKPQALRWHVREKNFEARYMDEQAGLAALHRRMAYAEASVSLPAVLRRLLDIGMGRVKQQHVTRSGEIVEADPPLRDQVLALRSYIDAMPRPADDQPMDQRPASLTLVDARSIHPHTTIQQSQEEALDVSYDDVSDAGHRAIEAAPTPTRDKTHLQPLASGTVHHDDDIDTVHAHASDDDAEAAVLRVIASRMS